MPDGWATDDDLHAAQRRFAAQIPGFAMPVAFTVARRDRTGLTFGHINPYGAVRPLPATVLAFVCGYVAATGVFRFGHEGMAAAIVHLTPAEAATHIPHPNLWSWRDLLDKSDDDSRFLAFFVADPADPPVDADDARFRRMMATPT